MTAPATVDRGSQSPPAANHSVVIPPSDPSDPVWDVPWLTELRTVPADATWPRLMSHPHPRAVGSLGADMCAHAQARTGKALRWHQRLIATRLLEVDPAGELVWDAALLSMARQLGKSWLLRELALWRLEQGDRFGEPQDIMHTGKDVAVCKEAQRPARVWAKAHPDLYKVREVNGQEEIERLADGSRWMLRAKESVYGYAASLAIVDETWAVAPATIDEGLVPTMVERVGAQLVMFSCAHRKATPLMLNRRLAALANLSASDDLLIEWSAPPDAELDDVDTWRAASARWDARRHKLITSALAKAQAGQSDDPDEPDPMAAFTAQWLNWWPARAAKPGPGEDLLAAGAWADCTGHLATQGAGWVALNDNYGKGGAAAMVATDGAGRYEVDGAAFDTWDEALELARWFVDQRPGSRLIVGASLWSQVPADFPNRSAMRSAGNTETSRGLALFRSLVQAGRVVHDDTAQLDAQVDGVRVRPNASGMLSIVPKHRVDLFKAALWALAEAQLPAPNPAVH